MTRTFRALLTALVLALPLLTSCNEASNPVEVRVAVQPQANLLGIVGNLLNFTGTLITGADANGPDASVWIGPAGGTISTAAYTLVVPPNAVSTSTRFDLEPTNTGIYSLDLHAYQKSGLLGLSLVEVGSKGFAKPVTLKVSYAKATNVTDAKSLVIIYIRGDATVEVQQSVIDTKAKVVSSELDHFSKYALSQN